MAATERHTFTAAVADLLTRRAGEWVDARELMRVGGAMAWRTRVSNARQHFGLHIENRVRVVKQNGHTFKVSEYRIPRLGQQELF